MLFFACLLCMNASSVRALDEWAAKVAAERVAAEELGARWKPVSTWLLRNGVSRLFDPMEDAFKGVRGIEHLELIAAAMRSWDGGGGVDGDLYGKNLSNYMYRGLLAESANKKKPKGGPPRWRSWAIVHVAQLILKQRVALRKALHLDGMAAAEVPTVRERTIASEARVAELTKERDGLATLLKKAADAKRKADSRKAAAKDKAAKAAKAKAAKQRADVQARVDARVERKAAAVQQRLKVAADADVQKRAKEVAKARARARSVEGEASLAANRLKRARKAEAKAKDLERRLDEMAEQLEPPASPTTDDEEERGNKFTPLPWKLCPLIWGQHARRTPPTAINQNITDVIRTLSFEKDVPLPCSDEIRRMRGQLTVAGECLAAFRVALARRVISFGFDESTKFGLGLLSTNTQIEPHDAPGTSVDVVQRGACLTAGGTAAEICKSIDEKIFSHSRRLLEGWCAEHEKKFGEGSWQRDGGPSPESIGMHRLSEQTLLMSDTCNAARAAKRLLVEAAEKAARLAIGDRAWAAMSEAQRERKCTSFIGDCHQHLRNIIINAMSIAATTHLKEVLEDDLAEFSSFDRMSVDCMDLIRAIWKELHPGQEYAKGKGREFLAWLKKHHPTAMYMVFENAKGSRQDMAFDGALPIFANRLLALDFLHGLVNVPRADNMLEKFIWRVLRCNEMTALLRVNTLFKLVITDAMRWLTGKAQKLDDWSIVSASRVLELAEEAFIKIAADGRTLLDPAFNPFDEITAKQPLFAKWQTERMKRSFKAADGKTKHRVYEHVLAEARAPVGKGNVQSTPATIALAEKMATAALTAMHDAKRAIADKLTSQDGINTPAKQQAMHKATVGAHVANDRVESIFGSYDYVGHIFRGTSVENLSGLAQQMRNHDFDRAENVRKRKQGGEPARDGFYHRLPERLQESLVAFARHEAPRARRMAKVDLTAHDDAKLVRREERVITLLDKAVEDYAFSKELFGAWEADTLAWRTKNGTRPGEVAKTDAKWSAFTLGKPESEVLMFLRKQISMRVIGLGWTEFATRWSSNKDSKIGTVAHLRELLVVVLEHEMTARRMNELPEEAALPQQVRRDLGQLGTVDEDAAEIEKRALFSADELAQKAEAAMQRRIEAGVSDSVEDLNGGVNGGQAPAFDQALVGKRLEVLWPYNDRATGKRVLVWATGRIARVADGVSDKRSKAGKTVLPAGMILWAWDADPEFEEPAGEKWLALLPKKWNKQQLYSWRYDPREFRADAAPQRDQRRQQADRMDIDA